MNGGPSPRTATDQRARNSRTPEGGGFTRVDAIRLALALTGLAAATLILGSWLHVSNASVVSTTYLTVILFAAATSRLAVAVLASLTAMLCLNFFFLPPVGGFTIADPENWVALFAFLAVSLVASNLSAVARARATEAVSRRDELARLFDLSRDVLMMSDSGEAMSVLARTVARRFDLSFAAVAVPRDREWDVYDAGTGPIEIDERELTRAFASAQTSLEFDAHARTYAGHRTVTVDGRPIRLVPLRVGTRPIGILAAAGRPVEAGTLDTLAGVVAIAIERAHLLEARKAGELARQSEQLKTALLASVGHDLRTPLTAIRVAASNLMAGQLPAEDQLGQTELILTEAERLTRLFENILEMARIDAGAVSTEVRWTHPSEIIAVAREQVEHTVQGHEIRVDIDADVPVRLDPRLTASALSHLLENASQYTPAGSPIDITARLSDEGLAIAVRDYGRGIMAADLPHLFERFYRGETATPRASGTGMGLWIVRGLLAIEGGRVWAENSPDGGAQFSMIIPAGLKPATTGSLGS